MVMQTRLLFLCFAYLIGWVTAMYLWVEKFEKKKWLINFNYIAAVELQRLMVVVWDARFFFRLIFDMIKFLETTTGHFSGDVIHF